MVVYCSFVMVNVSCLYFLHEHSQLLMTLTNHLQLLNYQLTGADAVMVLHVDVSKHSSFRYINHKLTVIGLCCIDVSFENGQHISGSRFTHDVVGTVDCLRAGVCHKLNRHVECCWYWDIQWYTQPIIGYRYHIRHPFAVVSIFTCSVWSWQKLQRIS